MQDLLYKIGITKIPLVGAVSAKNLISYCGGARAVFEARKKELLKIPGIGTQTASSIIKQDVLKIAEREIVYIEKNNIQPLYYLDKNFPGRLKHFNDCPIMLYYKGNANLNHHRIVAIVGTRKPSIHGISICEEFVQDLKSFNPLIVSGLAYGIDITAHRKCLDVGIQTIGVLGHGLSNIYPAQHRRTAEQMINHGGLLSEYTHDTPPDRENFPMRNRIVAGLCDALIVVETASKGGSIITAQMGNNYNRDVFAVPGRIKDKNSKGCNLLIKSHRAALIESIDDIAYVMRWSKSGEQQQIIQKKLFLDLSEEEKTIIDLLQKGEELGIDKLTFEAKMTNSQIASLLLELEFKGLVKTLPGKRYVLV